MLDQESSVVRSSSTLMTRANGARARLAANPILASAAAVQRPFIVDMEFHLLGACAVVAPARRQREGHSDHNHSLTTAMIRSTSESSGAAKPIGVEMIAVVRNFSRRT